MHYYLVDSKIRITIISCITILSVMIMFVIGIVVDLFGFELIPLVINMKTIPKIGIRLFTTGIIFTILFYVYDNFIWKSKLMYKIHKIPNLDGEWNGEFKSNKKDENENNYTGNCKMIIRQTFTKIHIVSHFNKSKSFSKTATININGHNGMELKFEYHNNAEKFIEENVFYHTGYNTLIYTNGNTLCGDYHTDRNRRTQGYIEVRRGESCILNPVSNI